MVTVNDLIGAVLAVAVEEAVVDGRFLRDAVVVGVGSGGTLTGLGGTTPKTTGGSKSLTVSGTFAMRRISEISEIAPLN